MQLITEGFNPGKLPEITQKVVDILKRRLGAQIGLDPLTVYQFKPETGGNYVGYKAAVNNGKALGFFYDTKFSLALLAVYKDFSDTNPDGYILLQGYNIVQVLEEIGKLITFYFKNGYLPNEHEMEEEFGLDHDGDIDCTPCFVSSMECISREHNRVLTVRSIEDDYFCVEETSYCFSIDVIKEIIKGDEMKKL